MNENILAILITIAALLGFVLFWSFVLWITSRVGGWATIAEKYPYREPYNPRCHSFQSAILRYMMNYNGVLNLCMDEEGVYFSVLFLFRPGHTPFFVPWDEIEGTSKNYFLYKVVDLRFAQTPHVPFYVYNRTADKLLEGANGRWAYKEKVPS